MNSHHDHPEGEGNGGRRRRANWALIGFLAIAAFFLLTEHRAHLLGVLPYLLLLACPLMHLFHGHGGHGGHGGHETDDAKEAKETPQAQDPAAHRHHSESQRSSEGNHS